MNVSRTGSTVHVQPREQVTGPVPRRASNLHPPRAGRPKAGFTIAASTVGSDEDEWVSSESGAATPMGDASGDEGPGKKSPQEVSPATPVDPVGQRVKGQNPSLVPGTTPRAEVTQQRPRVQTNGFVPTRPSHITTVPPTRLSDLSELSQYPQQEWDPYRQQPKSTHPQPDKAQEALLPKSRQPSTTSHIPDQTVSSKPLLVRAPEFTAAAGGARTEPPTPTSPRSEHYSTNISRQTVLQLDLPTPIDVILTLGCYAALASAHARRAHAHNIHALYYLVLGRTLVAFAPPYTRRSGHVTEYTTGSALPASECEHAS